MHPHPLFFSKKEIKMNHHDQFKVIGHIAPGALSASQTASVSSVIDTFGYSGGRLIITVSLGVIGQPALKCFVQESDDNSTYTTFVSATDTDVDGVAGVQVTADDDQSEVVFDIPLIGARKRYYQINYTTGSGGGKSNFMCHAIIIGKQIGVAQSTSDLTQRTGSKAYRASNA